MHRHPPANRARRTLLQDDGAGASANATAPAANATGAANATAKAPATLAAALAPAKANNLSTLVAAVEAANLTAPLANASTAWTIFAPNDAVRCFARDHGVCVVVSRPLLPLQPASGLIPFRTNKRRPLPRAPSKRQRKREGL